MKNIQIIDDALNCAYSIFQVENEDFYLIFPEAGQDVEFIEDFVKRNGEKKANKILEKIWNSPLKKKEIQGIHGTLFYQLQKKKKFYPNKKESDFDCPDFSIILPKVT